MFSFSKRLLITALAVSGISMPAIAQYKCLVNGKTVVQNDPCTGSIAPRGKYRCNLYGEVIFQDESCVPKRAEERKPFPEPELSRRQTTSISGKNSTSIDPTKDRLWIAQNQELIGRRLRDPDSARFSGSFVSRSSGGPVVCGYVNAKNGFGGYSGPIRFVSGGSVIQVLETDMGQGEMEKLWDQVCR